MHLFRYSRQFFVLVFCPCCLCAYSKNNNMTTGKRSHDSISFFDALWQSFLTFISKSRSSLVAKVDTCCLEPVDRHELFVVWSNAMCSCTINMSRFYSHFLSPAKSEKHCLCSVAFMSKQCPYTLNDRRHSHAHRSTTWLIHSKRLWGCEAYRLRSMCRRTRWEGKDLRKF